MKKGGLTHHENKNAKKMDGLAACCHDDRRMQPFGNIQFSKRFERYDQNYGAAFIAGKPE
ncbi:hypothetical protein SC09_Contig25orf00245 [Bacillus subtilis]|uniref:Uncharacterized protein n=1 Tax=Bacillus subtilis TaxID=1423 RepID=A0A0D1KW84_BACIU|nr:hypothetical protein SC09_Contig25orf00245 [Bacillus subtilis]